MILKIFIKYYRFFAESCIIYLTRIGKKFERGMIMAKKVKKGSIGAKIFSAMAIMTVIIVAVIVLDIIALGYIGNYNKIIGESCLSMEDVNGKLAASLEKVRMYSNLLYYEQVGETAEAFRGALKDAAQEVQTYGSELRTLALATEDADLTASVNTYLLSVSELVSCSERLMEAAETFDRQTFLEESALLSGYIDDMVVKEEEFGAALGTYCDYIMARSTIKISGTRSFDMILCGVIVEVAAVELLVVAKSVSGPAKKSRIRLEDIARKIDNGEGDLTERVPVSSNDEIGQMAAGVNNFIEQLQGIMRRL